MKRTFLFPTLVFLAATAFAQDNSKRGWRNLDDDSTQSASSTAPSIQAPAPSGLNLPAGTYVRVRVNEGLSTSQNRAGDSFTVTLNEPLVAQGYVVARRGQTFGGHVAVSEKGGRIKGTSRLGLELTSLTLVDGQQIPIRSELVQFSGGNANGRDAAVVVASSGLGAIIGGAAEGAGAAGIGAAAGAAAATIGVLTTRGPAAVVYPEDTLTFRTLAAIPINTDNAAHAFQAVRQSDYETAAVRTRQPVRTSRAAGPVWGGWGYPYPYYGYGPRVGFYGRFGGGGRRRR